MRRLLILIISLIIFSKISFAVVTVDGNVYLENQSDHTGIEVHFERTAPSSLTGTTTTNSEGYFTIELETGIYNITYSKNGYFDEGYTEYQFFSNTTLPDTTIREWTTMLYVPSFVCPTIQSAIDLSNNGDTVLVQPNNYKENIKFNGKKITVSSLFLTTNDTSYILQTIINGNKNGHVVEFSDSEDTSAILIGFTITNGYAVSTGSGIASERLGGGIYCSNSSPTIANVIIGGDIGGNTADSYGGGIYLDYSDAILKYVTISSNHANSGGGLYCYYSNPIITNVTISGNSANEGGGIYFQRSSPTITNVIIKWNNASNGGGIYCNYYSNPIITNGIINGNRSTNNSTSSGGGIYCNSYSNPTITNVAVIGNKTRSKGGGIYCDSNSSPTIANSIISDNINPYGGSCYGIYVNSGDPSISYSGFWKNGIGNFYNCNEWIGNNVTINTNGDSCDVYNNIQLSPSFFDSENGDYHLSDYSRCIGVGTSDGAPETDIEGNPRPNPNGSNPDLGAFESSLSTPKDMEIYNFDIGGDEDILHLITHVPEITFNCGGPPQTHYQIQGSTQENYSIIDMWDTGEVESNANNVDYAGNTLEDGVTYYLRGRYASGEVWSSWSLLSFRMNSVPSLPIQLTPLNGISVSSPVILSILNSTDAERDSLFYSFRIYSDSELTSVVDSIINHNETPDTTSWSTSNLNENQFYWWNVEAYDGYEKSGVTAADYFFSNSYNDTPTVEYMISDQSTYEDAFFTFTFGDSVFNDVDEGDSLRYSTTLSNGNALPSWLSFEETNPRTFSGTPRNEDVSTITVKVTATDDLSAIVFTEFNIEIINTNDVPIIVTTKIDNAVEDQEYNFTIEATDPDLAYGDHILYSLSVYPEGMTINSTTGEVSWLPDNEDVGDTTLTVSVTDDSSATNEKNFILTVNNTNDAPTVAYLIPDQSAYEDALFTFTFGDSVFIDVDTVDSLRYSAGLSDGTSLPNWLSFEASTPRTFTGTPLNENVGTITIKITAEDDSSATTSTEFNLEVINTNDAPVLNPITDKEMLEDSTLTVIVTAIDDDDMDQMELSVESDTSAVVAYFATGKGTELTRELILIPEGNWNGVAIITINVVDQVSKASDTDSFSLTVLPVNDSPELSNIPDQSFTINDTIQIFLNQYISDPDLPNDNISWSFCGGDSLVIILDASVAKITNKPEWVGIDSILFIATDDSSESDSDWVYINVIAIPSPNNLVAISGLGCVPLTWQPPDYVMTEELIYDDGSPAWLLTYYDGYKWATRMSPSWPCKILELKYYHGISGEFLPGIYEWNGTSPGEALLEFAYKSNSIDTGWVSVDISNYDIIVDGDFVVSHGFLNSEVEFGYESGDNGRSWKTSGYGWDLWNHYIYFIRAVVEELSSGKNVELGYGINNSTIPGSVEPDIIVATKNILNHYNIYRSESSGEPYTLIASNVTDTSYIDCDVELSSTYFYTVTSVFSDPLGESGFSNETFATTDFPPILGEIPDTSFHEDTILELPISFWYDYVKDEDNENTELTWTFFGADSVIVNVSTDKVKFSAPLNWYGVDTIEIAVSDGVYSDTSSLALTVYSVNDLPVITGIPNQTFAMNDTVQVFLNQYVSDSDLPNDNISWTFCTGENLLITLVDSIARITNVFGWLGTDSVLFIAKDDSMSSDSSWVNFTVVPIYSPRNLSSKSGLTYIPLIWNKPGPQIEELIYDNDSTTGASAGFIGCKTACRLTPPWPCKVLALKFYVNAQSTVTFLPGVYSWNGTSPGEVIKEFNHTIDASGWSYGWEYIDVSEYDIMVNDEFVVSFEYIVDYNPSIGISSKDNGRSWSFNPSYSNEWHSSKYTYFIRAIVEKIPGSKDGDTKEITELHTFSSSSNSFGEDVSYYNIYRSNVSGSSFELIESGIEDTTYTDLNVELGTNYYYVVTAVYSEPTVESEYSNEASAKTAFPPVLSSIPDTSFFEDDSLYFPIANLHDYVQDEDTPVDSLHWIVSQNQNVYFNFENDSIFISAEANWFGKDTVLLIVSDDVLSDSTNWIITVHPVNDPPYFTELIPDSISFDSNVRDTLLLAELASDVDNPDSTLNWSYIHSSFVLCDINSTLNSAIFWVEENLSGQDTIVLSISDGEFTVYDSLIVIVSPVTGIEYLMSQLPKEYSLKQNYPNPFNPTTTIIYGLPKSSHVNIRIYDLLGREVTTLVNNNQEAKHYKVIWDAKDRSGNTVPSGMYLYRIVAKSGDRTFVKTRKLLLMR